MKPQVIFGQRWLPVWLMAPQLLITGIFFLWPAAQAGYSALQIEDPFGLGSQFVGLENFARLLSDARYLGSFVTTLQFSPAVALLALGLALLLAALASQVARGRLFYRTLLIWPYAVAPVVAGALWLFLLDPVMGWLARLLQGLGLAWDPVLNGRHAFWMVVIAATWKQVSYNLLFFLAALQSVPRALLEAAAMDGSGPIKRFVTISLPLISPTSFFLLVVNLVYAFFDTFPIIHAMTRGGPGDSTATLVYKVFNDGFVGLDLGSSAAQSVLLMLLVAGLTALQFRYLERKVAY